MSTTSQQSALSIPIRVIGVIRGRPISVGDIRDFGEPNAGQLARSLRLQFTTRIDGLEVRRTITPLYLR
jgi:hypothetical protein